MPVGQCLVSVIVCRKEIGWTLKKGALHSAQRGVDDARVFSVYCLYTYRGKHAHNTSSGNHSATDARDGVFRVAGIGRTDVGLTPSKSRVCVDSFVVVFGEVVPIYN
jgi:hypothetical protein